MSRITKPQTFSGSLDTFSQEAKDFWKGRRATCVSWFAFMFVNSANILNIIYSASPSWGTTQEIIGQGTSYRLEGEVYGHYGVWYTCWDSVNGYGRTCLLWSESDFVPDWWPAFQSMITLSFLSGFAAFLLMAFYMFARQFNRNMKLLGLFIFAVCMAVLFSVAGFVVFCVLFLKEAYWCCHPDLNREMIHYDLYWGFFLCCIATGLYMIAGVAGIFECMDILKDIRIEKEFEEWRRRESMIEFQHNTYDPSFQNAAMMGYGNMWR